MHARVHVAATYTTTNARTLSMPNPLARRTQGVWVSQRQIIYAGQAKKDEPNGQGVSRIAPTEHGGDWMVGTFTSKGGVSTNSGKVRLSHGRAVRRVRTTLAYTHACMHTRVSRRLLLLMLLLLLHPAPPLKRACGWRPAGHPRPTPHAQSTGSPQHVRSRVAGCGVS